MKYFSIFGIVVMISGCSTEPNVIQHSLPFTKEGTHDLFIVSHGWHTGIIVSGEAVEERLPELEKRFGHTSYIEFGWGDKGFYQAKEITTGLVLGAMFWPTSSVVHTVAVPRDVVSYFGSSEIELLCLNDSELSSLIDFIAGSFGKNDNGELVSLSGGIYGDSQFYQGMGDYFLMNTCNKWTAKGLRSIGMDIDPGFKLTASSVVEYVRNSDQNATNQLALRLRHRTQQSCASY
ncbi:MAG: TIGR02117 family protein [Gammaproteobacteria bacterium]|nr:TIGR02117 family protein [Gammaproteobacteria bacterium]